MYRSHKIKQVKTTFEKQKQISIFEEAFFSWFFVSHEHLINKATVNN